MFRDTPVDRLTPNAMVLHLQPHEGISLHFNAKQPGQIVQLGRSGWISATRISSS